MPKRNISKEKSAFDKWFIENYSRLKESVSLMRLFDEDAFHEAYLVVISSKELKSGLSDYRKVFLTTYKTISRRSINECYTICHPDELFFTLLPDTEVEEAPQRDFSGLARTIRSFIHNTFSATQEAIWQMRLQGYSLQDTADSFGMSRQQVVDNVNTIASRTSKQFAYAM